MTPSADSARYKNHRLPGEIMSHGVGLYYRFPLSYRDVHELLFERGIDVTHEAIRQWCRKFGAGRREPTTAPAPAAGRQMAPGRGGFDAPREAALRAARRRSGRQCARHLGAALAQQARREKVFPQAAQGFAVRAACHHDRQVKATVRPNASFFQAWSTDRVVL